MTPEQSQAALAGAELMPVAEAAIDAIKDLHARCLAADIPAAISRDVATPAARGVRLSLLVRPDDLPRVLPLMGRFFVVAPEDGDAMPPCPACGTAAPLVAGACSDCGLQLE